MRISVSGRIAVAALPEVNLYTRASPAPHEADKQNAAQRLLGVGDLVLSVQVLQEFYQT